MSTANPQNLLARFTTDERRNFKIAAMNDRAHIAMMFGSRSVGSNKLVTKVQLAHEYNVSDGYIATCIKQYERDIATATNGHNTATPPPIETFRDEANRIAASVLNDVKEPEPERSEFAPPVAKKLMQLTVLAHDEFGIHTYEIIADPASKSDVLAMVNFVARTETGTPDFTYDESDLMLALEGKLVVAADWR